MGENPDKKFVINDDGTIIRNKKCPKCGKVVISEGEFCPLCGANLNKPSKTKKKKVKWWIWLLGTAIAGIALWLLLWLGFGIGYNYDYSNYHENGEDSTDAYSAEELIYEPAEELIYSTDHEWYCNGEYEGDKSYFYTNLHNLNRHHFRIVFSFKALTYTGTWWCDNIQYPLMLSRGYRVLGVVLNEQGYVGISVNNKDKELFFPITYQAGEYTTVDLEYNNGTITINGESAYMPINEYEGDNELTSINYSSGNAFYGYIRDVYVYNYK